MPAAQARNRWPPWSLLVSFLRGAACGVPVIECCDRDIAIVPSFLRSDDYFNDQFWTNCLS